MSLFLIFILIITCPLVHSKSFVIVTDTTGSMRDDLDTLKNHIESVIKTLPLSGEFENYILVPFSDPDVGVPKTSRTPEDLLNFLNELEVRGGNDCPENSLAAVEKALGISKEFSSIFLFTDAPAKDVNKLPVIQALCRQRQSQVVTFVSGECSGETNNTNIYNEIAKSCNGAAFHLDIQHLKQAFKYMKEIVSVSWSDIQTHKEFMGRKQFNFNVDKFTKSLLVAVAGDYPEIQITNAAGEIAAVEKIIDTKNSLVVRLQQLEISEYKAEICSRGLSLTTFYKWKTLDFLYGFSPKKPKNLNETTNEPLPDATSYVTIELLDSDIEVFVLELKINGESTIFELEVLDENKGLYAVQVYFKANTSFRMTLLAREKTTQEIIRGTKKMMYPQTKGEPRSIAPTVEAINPSTLVEFMTNATLYCKVTGEPKPDIWWEDDNENRLDSEIFFFQWPSTYASYGTIKNVTTNSTVYCKGKNSEGESSRSTDVFVHREFTFEILQSPSDITVEYGYEGKLFCEATAYPEATIKWYHNDTAIENSENVEIVPDENMLLIKNMSLEDTGEYKCEVENSEKTRSLSAVVDISGLESPEVELPSSELILKPGDSVEVTCQITKGSPTPEVNWKKKVDDYCIDVPEDISVEDNILKISSAKSEHNGQYRCSAENIVGVDFKEVEIKVQYAPVIKNGDEIRMVNAGETVQLECNVEAEPKAVVHWDMSQDDVTVGFDDRHSTDDRNNHHFIAQPSDSGTYYCVAENEVGRAERKVTVIILEAPFIEPLEFKTHRARVGGSLHVSCNVSLGRPVPETRWEFISKSATTVISRQTTSKLDLVLRNISKANEGYYQCVTENIVGPDTVKFFLTVTQ